MVVRCWIRGLFPVEGIVHVVETSSVQSKTKSPQITSGKRIGKPFSLFDIEQLKCSGALPTLFYFVQEQAPVLR